MAEDLVRDFRVSAPMANRVGSTIRLALAGAVFSISAWLLLGPVALEAFQMCGFVLRPTFPGYTTSLSGVAGGKGKPSLPAKNAPNRSTVTNGEIYDANKSHRVGPKHGKQRMLRTVRV